MANCGSSGTHEVRWYSGRTAREQPREAASLMCAEAAAKLASGSRGYMMPFSGLG